MFREQHTHKNFAPKREEVSPGWIKMHNKELHGLYFSPHITTVLIPNRIFGRVGMHESAEKWVNCMLESLKGRNLSTDIGIGIKMYNKEI
jgi:hypothetical protein